MNTQNITAGFRSRDRCVPLETGQTFPDLGVFFMSIREFRQQAAATDFRQFKMTGRP